MRCVSRVAMSLLYLCVCARVCVCVCVRVRERVRVRACVCCFVPFSSRQCQSVVAHVCLVQAPPTRLHAQQLTAHTKDLVKLSPHIFDHYNHVETDLTGPVVRPPLDAVPPHLDNHNPAAASTLQGGATLVDIDEVPEHLAREGVADSARASFAGPELPRFDEEDAKLVDDHPAFEERSVPAHPVSRVLGFGQLAVGMVLGAAGEVVKRGVGLSTPSPEHDSVVMSEANAERLTRALCKMRGAALKLGQMLSMQDDTTLPPVVRPLWCFDALALCCVGRGRGCVLRLLSY